MNTKTTPLQRFVLFGGMVYYASGGWLDMQGDYADHESAWAQAQQLMEREEITWWQIVDLQLGEIVGKSDNQAHC